MAVARQNGERQRVLPHDLDLEASILGGVVLQNEVIGELDNLETSDFYHLPHRVVWDAIRNLRAKDRPIDIVTLRVEIEMQGKLDAIGGVGFLGELVLRVPTVDNIRAYRDTVLTLSRNRRAILELSAALERAYEWPHDPNELVSEVAGQLTRLQDTSKAPKRLRLISVAEALEDLQRLAASPVYPSPFPSLNDAIGFGGFLGTQVYTVCAGTGRGKTTWVAAVAAHAAETVPVVVASYEMKPGYFVARRAAGLLGVHSNAILRCEIPLHKVLEAVPYPRLQLLHRPSLLELREAVLFMTAKYGTPPLVIVDYIQKLADEIALTQQRPDLRIATNTASTTLCDIAEKTGAAIVAVSAIGRGKGKIMQTPRRFEPYELVEVAKESGAVEYDGAGLIVLTLQKEQETDENGRIERHATMTLAKARFGTECHIDARYDGRRGLWRDLGIVEREEEAKTSSASSPATAPKETATMTELKQRLIKSLSELPSRGKDNLVGRVKGKKIDLRRAYEELEAEGVITKVGGWLTLSEVGRQRLIVGV